MPPVICTSRRESTSPQKGKGKDAVAALTAPYMDKDLPEGLDREDALGPNGGTDFSRLKVLSFTPQPFVVDNGDGTASAPLPDADEMDELIARAERTRAALNHWIMRNMKPGLHFGTYPVDERDNAAPTARRSSRMHPTSQSWPVDAS